MFNCCITSTLRICHYNEEINQNEIDEFVSKIFPKE